ncbi:MAG: hypothetical protein AAFY08_12260 [Planctomycetota bacterium]
MSEASDESLNLVVFSDDWGRHPSSCQHLVRHLMRRGAVGEVVWVNTIGTRRVRLSWADAKRAAGKVGGIARTLPPMHWFWPAEEVLRETEGRQGDSEVRPRVVSPMMWPGFRAGWQRRFNAKRMVNAVRGAIDPGKRWVGLTTLPITADVVEPLRELPGGGVGRWVYYGVDDFSVWPGLDGDVMDAMERELVGKVDAICVVSQTLVDRVCEMLNHGGRENAEGSSRDVAHPGVASGHASRQDAKSPSRQVELLTHGVDIDEWNLRDVLPIDDWWTQVAPHPIFLFWGLLDERMDADWWWKLVDGYDCTPCQLGPIGPEPGLNELPNNVMPGRRDHAELPRWASWADVLVMPYRDMPVTRAMQPLKLLEYLATYKPVVVRRLPATEAWADCCDVVETAEEFVRVCRERADGGLPADQRAARERRLPGESWSEKSRELEAILRGGGV